VSLFNRSGLIQRDAADWFAAIAAIDRDAARDGRFVAASIVLAGADGAALRAMCGRPLGCKSFEENSDGWVDCDHVSGLLTRRHDRWPRWGPRSSPKQRCGFESRGTERVAWIVGSTDRHLVQLFHPGIDARFRR
jgi:hypothetical protein